MEGPRARRLDVTATSVEVRVSLSAGRPMTYALAPRRAHFRLAAENPDELLSLRRLLDVHPDGRVRLFGEHLDEWDTIARDISAPLITGPTPQADRERLDDQFRAGRRRSLVVSQVGNLAIDLPDADVLVQVSGTFGSRQEEAQRLGPVLRPKPDGEFKMSSPIAAAAAGVQRPGIRGPLG